MENSLTHPDRSKGPFHLRASDVHRVAERVPAVNKRSADLLGDVASEAKQPPTKKCAVAIATESSPVAVQAPEKKPAATKTSKARERKPASTKAFKAGEKKPASTKTSKACATAKTKQVTVTMDELLSDTSETEDKIDENNCGDVELETSAGATKRRVSYTTKQDCLVLEEVLGDGGLFDRKGESKTGRWVSVTTRMSEVLDPQITPDGLRKHLEVLVKKHRKLMTKERSLSVREPKKTVDQIELEALLTRYIELKEDEDASKAERVEIRSKKAEEDRVGGEIIRDAALKCEKPKKSKQKGSKKRSDPLEFLRNLTEAYETRRESETRERLDREERIQTRVVDLQEQQVRSHQQIAQMIAVAMQAFATSFNTTVTCSDTSPTNVSTTTAETAVNTTSSNTGTSENSCNTKNSDISTQ